MNPFQAVNSNDLEKIKKHTNLQGVNLNLVDEKGNSLLDYAVINEYEEMAILLHSAGAKIVKTSKFKLQTLIGSMINQELMYSLQQYKAMANSLNAARRANSNEARNNNDLKQKNRPNQKRKSETNRNFQNTRLTI